MIETIDPKTLEKPVVRCAKCDTEVSHYNSFVEPDNTVVNVCWQCLQREEKASSRSPASAAVADSAISRANRWS